MTKLDRWLKQHQDLLAETQTALEALLEKFYAAQRERESVFYSSGVDVEKAFHVQNLEALVMNGKSIYDVSAVLKKAHKVNQELQEQIVHVQDTFSAMVEEAE